MKRTSPLLFIFLCSPLFSLDGDWRILNALTDVRDAECLGNSLYCATSGGLSVINPATGETRQYTVDNGLGDASVSVVAADRATGRIFLGLDNGVIAVFHEGAFRLYQDFRTQKGIRFNKFLVHRGALLAATNEGLGFFSEEEGSVFSFFTMFGESDNPFLSQAHEIRDMALRSDTLYLLTRYFWAKAYLDPVKPLSRNHPGLRYPSPSFWTTNGASREFAVPDPEDPTYIKGYARFAILDTAILGLTDLDTYQDAAGNQWGLSLEGDSVLVRLLVRSPSAASFPLETRKANPYASYITYKAVAASPAGEIFVGTGGRGVFCLSDDRNFWTGEDQVFSDMKTLRVDRQGNVYAINVNLPGMGLQNSINSAGILRWSPSQGWTHLYSSSSPATLPPGVNDILVDPYDRLFASISETHEDKVMNPVNHGAVVFDKPWSLEPFPAADWNAGPRRHLALNPLPYGIPAPHYPSAIYYSPYRLLYVCQSVPAAFSTYPGHIAVYRDYSLAGGPGGYSTSCDVPPPFGGFKKMGEIQAVAGPNDFGRLNCLTTDKAGNIWGLQSNKPPTDVNLFGLLTGLSTNDTLIYDSDIKTHIADQSGHQGLPECRVGFNAYRAQKTLRKVKTDLYGDVWTATTSGLFYYAEGRDTLGYGNGYGNWRFFMPEVIINDFDFDSLNNVWVATSGYGLKMVHFSTARYPTPNVSYGVGDRSKVKIESYGLQDGLLSNEVASVAVHRGSGRIFLGFENGLQSFESGVRASSEAAKGYVYPVLIRNGGFLFLNTKVNGSTVTIRTLSGKLILNTVLPSHQSSLRWNTRNPVSGRAVANGVYLYRFVTPGNQVKTGKFAVAR